MVRFEYAGSVTGLLEQALHRLEALPPEEQDAMAARILETLDADAVEAIRLGIEAAEQGRVKPAREAFAELQRKLGIPD